jgi:hypothetical protein
MRAAALDAFLREQVARAKAEDVLFSVHLKATMMKVSDPIIFGHVVRAFLPEVFERYGADLDAAGLSPNNGLGGILDGLGDASPTATRSGPPSSRAWPTARAWRWSTPTRASPTCTCRATSSSTPRCRR